MPAVDARTRPSLRGHLAILRLGHWVKNVFVLPGVVVAASIDRSCLKWDLAGLLVLGLLATGLIASSNYVLNAILDAPFDRFHPVKRLRPVPSGAVSLPLAYAQWIALMLAGAGLGLMISMPFAAVMLVLWVMGCVYNVPPLRAKDVPYVDILTEAVNNPLRMLAGWYLTRTPSVPTTSLLISYWMIGCYFMAIKRLAEYRDLGDPARSAAYRKSFAWYTEARLLAAIVFFGSQAMLFFGAFIMRYRLELVLAFPLIAWVMAAYLALAFKPGSAAQEPEKLYREPALMVAVVCSAALMTLLLFVDLPVLHRIFAPTVAP